MMAMSTNNTQSSIVVVTSDDKIKRFVIGYHGRANPPVSIRVT